MKKKIIIITLFLVIIFFIIYKLTNESQLIKSTYLKDNEEYKNVKVEQINNITVNRYTEGGLDSTIVSGAAAKKLYKSLADIKYGEETDMACEDNSTIYIINLVDGSSKTINIECDWIIIGKKRYMIVK